MLINGQYIKGSISFDTSKKKGDGMLGIKRHAAWRAVVVYDGKRYRKRSIDRTDCERFLVNLAASFAEKEQQRKLEEELANFQLVP
jgi:hypothetical protein